MGQHQRRPAGHHRLQRGPQARLGRLVEVGGRLVQHEDRGVAHDRAGDREAPPLAAAEAQAVLADAGPIAVGQRVDEVRELRGLERPAGPLVRQVGVGQGEVVADRRVEQVDALGHDGEQRAGVVRGDLPEVATADPDPALRVRLEPEQQLHQRRLARAARPHDREPPACRDRERQVVDDVARAARVAEAEAVDLEPEGRGRGAGSAGSTTAGRASISSNSRPPAASVASSRCTAAASGPTASNVAIAASGSTASSTGSIVPSWTQPIPSQSSDGRAQPGHQRGPARGGGPDRRQARRRAVHRARRPQQPRPVGLVAVERREVRDAPHGVERERGRERARGDPLARPRPRGEPHDRRQDEPRGDREGQQHPAGERLDPAQQHAAERDRAPPRRSAAWPRRRTPPPASRCRP